MKPFFVELDVEIEGQRLSARQVVSGRRNTLLTGIAGSGKTTLLREVAEASDPSEVCVISLREILDFHHSVCDLVKEFAFSGHSGRPSSVDQTIQSNGSNAEVQILLDGADEIPPESSEQFSHALTSWISELPKVTWIVSSRPVHSLSLPDNFQNATILPFGNDQIKRLADQYNIPDQLQRTLTESDKFGHLTKIPLFAELMCGIYQNYGQVPVERSAVFQKYIHMILEEWDESRAIVRKGISPKELMDLLEDIALELWSNQQISMSRDELVSSQRLASQYGLEALNEVFDDTRFAFFFSFPRLGSFSFIHRSFQEFFTARAIVKSLNGVELITKFDIPNELLEWIISRP